MPLKKGKSKKVISGNIREMMKAEHSQKQSVAAAMKEAGRGKKAAKTRVIATISFAHVVIDQVIARCILSFLKSGNALQSPLRGCRCGQRCRSPTLIR